MKRRQFVQSLGAGSAVAGLGLLSGCATTGSGAKVVVVGGGYGGATAAKYVRLFSDHGIDVTLIEPNAAFISCPISNLVIGGHKTMADITTPYDNLSKRHGVKVVRDMVASIDPAKRTVKLASGGELPYDRLIVSPGIDFMMDSMPGMAKAGAADKVLHAWKAGPQTVALRQQHEAMPDGGLYALSIPLAPAALDASTGRQIWKAYNVDEPKPWKVQANGVQLYGPSAGGVWNAPTIDPVRGAVYVGTGDAVTPPESPLTDAVMAVDLQTGKVLWAHRATENDMFRGGCGGPERSDACPSPMGPDHDIGNSPILVTLPNGKRALLIGTKSADVLALDPDNNGAVLFRVNPAGQPVGGSGRGRGAIVWGGAADARQVYYGMGAAGLAAVQATDGRTAWVFSAPGANGRGVAALGAAPTTMPGVVFQGAGDGRLFAVSAADGKPLWEFNTAQEFDTINKVSARGGAIATSGAVVVDGMVYVGSGYGISSAASGGNVLLAFGVE
jgi:outer membrane protein assembly factor BamB